MVDYARRKPNILLSTYGEAVCGRRGCGRGHGSNQLAFHQLTADRGEERLPYLVTLPGPDPDLNPKYDLESGEESGNESGQEQDQDEDTVERYNAGRGGGGRESWLERLQDSSSDPQTPTDACCREARRDHRTAVTWQVSVSRGSRGLGLSIEPAPGRPGQVRVKSVFVHQPAALTGRIRSGDLLLSVNDMPVRGLSVQEVLHVLRIAGSEVLLSLSRPAESDSDSDSADSAAESGVTPERGSRASLRLPLDTESHGTFTVELHKVNNTLGLSLRRTDGTVLGHTIRAKVREPALSDTRLRVGDKLLQVNGVDTTALSHAEVVSLLRRCSDRVALTLYRDGMATPGSPGSPVSGRSTRLRPEAVEMLTGLAFRREHSLPPGDVSPGSHLPGPAPELNRRRSRAEQVRRLSCGSRGSPRVRRRRLTPSPEVTDSADPFSRLSGVDDMDGVTSERLDQLTRISESSALADTEEMTSQRLDQVTSERLDQMTADRLDQMTSERLDQMTSERLDQMTCVQGAYGGQESEEWPESGEDSDAELHERHLRRVAEETAERSGSGRSKQLYRSVQPQQRVKSGRVLKRISSEERLEDGAGSPEVGGQLGKWKGFDLAGGGLDLAGGGLDLADGGLDLDTDSGIVSGGEASVRGQSVSILLRRGWSARLGFSLHSTDGSHVVSQIHPDSVAERDGRLQVGDVLTKVNDLPLRGLTSEQVIELLRKTKGAISLSVVRP